MWGTGAKTGLRGYLASPLWGLHAICSGTVPGRGRAWTWTHCSMLLPAHLLNNCLLSISTGPALPLWGQGQHSGQGSVAVAMGAAGQAWHYCHRACVLVGQTAPPICQLEGWALQIGPHTRSGLGAASRSHTVMRNINQPWKGNPGKMRQ